MHPSTRRLTRGLAAALTLICLTLGLAARPVHAQAGYYTYTLNNVSFNVNGSGTASGYFDYDPTTGTLGAFDLTTSDGTDVRGSSVQGVNYDSADGSTSAIYPSSGEEFSFFNGDDGYGIDFADPLSVDSPTVVQATGEGTKVGSNEINPDRFGSNTGTVTVTPAASAVPELSPLATIALLSVLGCGALGLAGARQRRRTTGAAI